MRVSWGKAMTAFLIALQFLTIIPIELKSMPNAQQQRQSLLFYPVVGALLGLLLYGVALSLAVLPTIMLATLILLLWVVMTGGLHLDGLADAADAWVGGFGDRERTLAIMKDPRCGPIGVLSLLLQCLMKWSAIYVLLQHHYALALILFPILGRMAPIILLASTDYVRAQGIASHLVSAEPQSFVSHLGTVLVLLFSAAISLYWSWQGILTVVVVLLNIWILRHMFIRRVGGVTGDLLGASIELTETVALWSLVCALLYSTAVL